MISLSYELSYIVVMVSFQLVFFLFNEVEILRKDLIASIKEIVIMNSDGRCKIYLETQEKFCDPRFPRNASAILVLVW